MLNPLKRLVSENRQRYVYDNVDLDLSYITARIIAMGYPSEGVEGLYRNHWMDVKNFLEKHHDHHYKIFNLRAEKTYDKTKFSAVTEYPFKDHQVPPLTMIQDFCSEAADWLDQDEANVVVVHCKAGKGRTGLMIAALLLYTGQAKDAQEAVMIYGTRRTTNGKGVTIPSQIRYVGYYRSSMHTTLRLDKKMVLKTLKLHPVPTKYLGNGGRWVMFHIMDQQNTVIYDQDRRGCVMTRSAQTLTIETKGIDTITGDFKVQFSCYHHWKKRSLCHFWLNTAFLGDSLVLAKHEIDQAFLDKSCKEFDPDFTIELGYDLY